MSKQAYLKITYSFALSDGYCIYLDVKSYNKKIIDEELMFIVAMEQEFSAFDFIKGERANFSMN